MLTIVHISFGFSALILGLFVLFMKKGSVVHRSLGLMYFVSIIILNITSFSITTNTGSLGVFHLLAILNLVTTITAFFAILYGSFRLHYYLMVWSYVGLLSATINQIFASVPAAAALLESFPLINLGVIMSMFLATFIILPMLEDKMVNKYKPD
ncbi:DUF2306 domain-containing protein [Marinicellulosiphila megalodicopiae]|uniref:DUF2306 domain-containing protein n=1 Tax=Marinicellulosiphila megalodicopiae TaxID=2724896 RepID=UPI003BAFD95B